MRAKHDSQAFGRLTNESATPPTKLYSPFNIYLDSGGGGGGGSKDAKRKQTLDRNRPMHFGHFNNSMEMDCDQAEAEGEGEGEGELDGRPNDNNHENQVARDLETPAKRRIALQHKRHLIQANKFTFDSPTGRLRETVRDVEQFQQCIEDISKAIKARDRLLGEPEW